MTKTEQKELDGLRKLWYTQKATKEQMLRCMELSRKQEFEMAQNPTPPKRKYIPNPEGRPKIMKDGRARTIYIDEQSWEKAKQLGDGKPSEGIRQALSHIETQ